MSEKETQIEVTNPAIIAAFTPLAALLPIMSINVSRHLSYPADNWALFGMVVLVISLFVVAIVVGKKKFNMELRADGLQVGKRLVTFDQIESITYNKRNRYLRVKTRPAMRGCNVYLGFPAEAASKAAQVETWARDHGLNFQ